MTLLCTNDNMASLQFEGALYGVSEKQVNFIREVLEARGFQYNKVLFEPASKAGDNIVASVLRIIVTVDGGDDFTMIAKVAPQLESVRDMMNINYVFNNEAIMYGEVLPKYNNLQMEAGVPENEMLKYAKCYGCLSEQPDELILLEDLKSLDYVMLDRLKPLTEEAILLVLKNFAILHSMSFVLMHLEPETYNQIASRLVKVKNIVTKTEDHIAFMEVIENSALETLDDEQYKKAIRGVVSQIHVLVDQTRKYENPKYLVIQQGDAWTNNFMFKLIEEKPVDTIMIDYQLSSETSPVADILYFIFNCTNHATRLKHYHNWINFYHEQLDKSLSNFGLKANFVYPKDQLDADLKRYSKLFFSFSVMTSNILSRNPEEIAEMHDAIRKYDKSKMEGIQMKSLSESTKYKYKHILQGLVDSYREFGYIN